MSLFKPLRGPDRPSNSDSENPYFRACALRGSEGSNSSGRGAATNSAPASPKSIPTTVSSPPDKVRKSDRHRLTSETGNFNSPIVQSPLHAFGVGTSGSGLLDKATDDTHPIEDRSSSIVSSKSGSLDSRKSSFASRAQKLLNLSHNTTKDSIRAGESPPHTEQTHHQRQCGTTGHRIDLHLGKKRQSVETMGEVHPATATSRTWLETEPLAPSLRPRHKDTDTTPSSPHPSAGTPLSLRAAKAGIYSRTKRALRIKKEEPKMSPKTPPPASRTGTSEVLDRTSSALRQWVDKGQGSEKGPSLSSASTSTSTLSIAAQRWRSRHLGFPSSDHSSANSFQSLLPGISPAPTPDPRSMYTGSDQRQYLVVELTDPKGPAFLPSEALRISTPPLVDRFQGKRKLRGFFFDYNTPPSGAGTPVTETPGLSTVSDQQDTPLTDVEDALSATDAAAVERKVLETDWYRTKLDAIEADDISREDFVISVPEHLPNSPMCPRHPKNKSAGKGVCVYHGRNLSRKTTGDGDTLNKIRV